MGTDIQMGVVLLPQPLTQEVIMYHLGNFGSNPAHVMDC